MKLNLAILGFSVPNIHIYSAFFDITVYRMTRLGLILIILNIQTETKFTFSTRIMILKCRR